MRVANWPFKMGEAIAAWRGRAFEWGRSDCCQFVGEISLAITGEDRREFFGVYKSPLGAARIVEQHGGMQGLLSHAFGEPSPAAKARRGDVVLCEFGNGLQPAIVEGATCCAPSLNGGLARRRVIADKHYPDAVLAWSVG